MKHVTLWIATPLFRILPGQRGYSEVSLLVFVPNNIIIRLVGMLCPRTLHVVFGYVFYPCLVIVLLIGFCITVEFNIYHLPFESTQGFLFNGQDGYEV